MIMRKIILLLTLCLSFPVYAVQYGMRWTAVPPPAGGIVTGYNVCISANDIPVFPAMLNDCIRRSIISSYTATIWYAVSYQFETNGSFLWKPINPCDFWYSVEAFGTDQYGHSIPGQWTTREHHTC